MKCIYANCGIAIPLGTEWLKEVQYRLSRDALLSLQKTKTIRRLERSDCSLVVAKSNQAAFCCVCA